jgi:hypothetical protein
MAGAPPPPAVARRREAIVRESEAALRGDRSVEAISADLKAAVGARKR